VLLNPPAAAAARFAAGSDTSPRPDRSKCGLSHSSRDSIRNPAAKYAPEKLFEGIHHGENGSLIQKRDGGAENPPQMVGGQK